MRRLLGARGLGFFSSNGGKRKIVERAAAPEALRLSFAIERLEDRRMLSAVVGRHVFYNNSYFDGNNPAVNAADDGAIDTGSSGSTLDN